jgi:Ca2+-binding EF-hand superfamily protein
VKAISNTAAAALTLAMLAGCGTTGAMTAVNTRVDAGSVTESSTGLKKAFTRIHKAIFTSMDANKDGWVDEYEAGKHMTMKEFQQADKSQGWGSAERLSRTEFVDWATHTFLWFHDDAASFANRFRQDLGKVFNRLDENRDGLLVKSELSNRDVAKLRLSFEYDKLHIHVPIKKIPAESLAKADKTGDGNLSQAEFEDLYLDTVVEALGGDGSTPPAPPAPSPAPSEAPPAPPAPPAGK